MPPVAAPVLVLEGLAPAVEPPAANATVVPLDEFPPAAFALPRPVLPAALDTLLLLPEQAAIVSATPATNRDC